MNETELEDAIRKLRKQKTETDNEEEKISFSRKISELEDELEKIKKQKRSEEDGSVSRPSSFNNINSKDSLQEDEEKKKSEKIKIEIDFLSNNGYSIDSQKFKNININSLEEIDKINNTIIENCTKEKSYKKIIYNCICSSGDFVLEQKEGIEYIILGL